MSYFLSFFIMSQYNKQLGRMGEAVAVRELQKNGFSILDTNVCFWGGELDIVAERDDCIHFVEVKTRSSETFLPLCQSVSTRQVRTIDRAARNYLAMKKIDDVNWQIDLLAIIIKNERVAKIEYFEDIDF